MTLPRLDSLIEYWAQNPPVHQLMAAFVGFKPPKNHKLKCKNGKERKNELSELLQIFGQAGVKVIKNGQ